MEALGIIILLAVGFVIFRFFVRANNIANAVHSAQNTVGKFKMSIEIVRQKFDELVAPGPMTPEKETYISYLYEIGVAWSVVDEWPETFCQAFVMQEARTISNLPENGDSEALMQQCRESANGAIGSSMGKVDGRKHVDRYSSQPYFVELDKWLAQREESR